MIEPLFIRAKDLPAITGLSISEIYARVKAGTFPKSIKLGPQTAGWTPESLRAWRDKLISEQEAQQ